MKRARKSFNLNDAIVGLFRRAERESNYAGCASLARVIRDLGAADDRGATADSTEVPLDQWIPDERRRAQELLKSFRRLKSEVRARVAGPQNPINDEQGPAIRSSHDDVASDVQLTVAVAEPAPSLPPPEPGELTTVSDTRGRQHTVSRRALDAGAIETWRSR